MSFSIRRKNKILVTAIASQNAHQGKSVRIKRTVYSFSPYYVPMPSAEYADPEKKEWRSLAAITAAWLTVCCWEKYMYSGNSSMMGRHLASDFAISGGCVYCGAGKPTAVTQPINGKLSKQREKAPFLFHS